jgi:hypothetical protein
LAAILLIFSLFLILTIANPIFQRLKESENNNTSSEKNYETILGYTSNGKVFKIFNEIKNDEINDCKYPG